MSRVDRFTEIERKNEAYSDFLTNLNPHPVSGETLRYVNEVAVTRSIRNLVSTQLGERLYQPSVGTNTRSILFEPMSDAVTEILRNKIEETISNYEPRAKVLQVVVVPNEDQNRYTINIAYMLINKSEPITANFTLQRLR